MHPEPAGASSTEATRSDRLRPRCPSWSSTFANEGDGWQYVVDALTLGLEDALATPVTERASVRSGPTLQEEMADPDPPARRPTPRMGVVAGPADGGNARGPGRRTTQHQFRSRATDEPRPSGALPRCTQPHPPGAAGRGLTGTTSPLVDRVLKSEDQIIERLRRLSAIRAERSASAATATTTWDRSCGPERTSSSSTSKANLRAHWVGGG